MPKPTFTIGVFAVIFDNKDRILLCHRTDYDLWNLPGGCLEYGETPWEAVIREVKEETGLDVKVERMAGVYNKINSNDIVFQFVCTVVGGKIIINDEADKIKYFEFSRIPKNTPPKHVERIKDIIDNPNKIITKTQEGRSTVELIKDGLI